MESEIEISEQTLRDVLTIREMSKIPTKTLREVLKTVDKSKKSLVERITEYAWFKKRAKNWSII